MKKLIIAFAMFAVACKNEVKTCERNVYTCDYVLVEKYSSEFFIGTDLSCDFNVGDTTYYGHIVVEKIDTYYDNSGGTNRLYNVGKYIHYINQAELKLNSDWNQLDTNINALYIPPFENSLP